MALTPEQTAMLQQRRVGNAQNKEFHALQVEVARRQWQRVSELNPADHNAMMQAQMYENQLVQAREEAKAASDLAETTRADFYPHLKSVLEDRKRSFETDLLVAYDAQEHPDAYGPAQLPPEFFEQGIEIVTEMIEELDNERKARNSKK